MTTHSASHQGNLRGSVTIPAESDTDGDGPGYKSAKSEFEGDDQSSFGDPPPKYTKPRHNHNQSGEDIEVEELPGDTSEQQSPSGLRRKTPKDSPAYVAPIGKIPSIPSIQPIASHPHTTPPPDDDKTTPKQKKAPVHRKKHLIGKKIDEYGDVVDEEGNVLASVEGDLPSMVGRTISNARGDVLGDDGVLLGYVTEVESEEGQEGSKQVPTWDMADVMKAMAAAGKGPGGLRVDPFGNIYDGDGNVVGSFQDNVSGFGKKSAAAGAGENAPNGDANQGKSRTREPDAKAAPHKTKATGDKADSSSKSRPPQENAQSHRKEDPALSPSDIFLDVKSTTEGIQLTIRIPTVFNSAGQPAKPKIVFE